MRAFAGIFLPLMIAYGGALVWIWDSWMLPDSYYSHGPLVVALVALLVWAWRRRWGALQMEADGRGWYLLLPALCLHLIGAALTIDSLSAASLVLAVPGAVLLACGPARWRVLAPVLGLTLFAIPLPMFVTGALAFELKEVAISAGLRLSELIGVAAERHGAEISVPGREMTLQVADPCSGLRSLVSLATLGYCIAFFMGEQRGARRWLLLALAFPVAVLTNIVRIAGICWMARTWGVPFATGVGHNVISYLAWFIDLGILLAFDFVLSRRGRMRG